MKKLNTSPISGTQELLPTIQATFDNLKSTIHTTFSLHGFLNIETPILERQEILFAKAGGDTEKQIYQVFKTSESGEDSTEALRFDHTVPLARYIVEHESDLTFPFKISQIGKNFRGERAQKGRFREFYQCDIDVIARNNLPLEYDADILATLIDTYQNLKIKTPVIARISNRKILKGLLEGLNLEDKSSDIYSIIDHSEKVPMEKTNLALDEIGLAGDNKQKILDFIRLNGGMKEVTDGLAALGVKNSTLDEGINELARVAELLSACDYDHKFILDMRIVRGLDYYTGTVFEFFMPDFREVGSIGGGGRYENLTEYFSDQKFPGVGGSIGLSRLFYILKENNLIDFGAEKPIDFAIIPLERAEEAYALAIASGLRSEGKTATVVYGDKKLGDKMKYASKIAKSAIVIGENEVKSGKYEIKKFV